MRKYAVPAIIFLLLLFLVPAVFSFLPFFGGAEKPTEFTVLLTGGEEEKTAILTAEEYLIGCLYAQIPLDYELEALKAQAAAAYTYAAKLKSLAISGDTDFSDDTATAQPYFTEEKAREYYGADYDKYYENVCAAAKWGAGRLLTDEKTKKPIYAVYHSVSAGRTNIPEAVWDCSLDCLCSVDSAWDKDAPNFRCTNQMTTESVRAALLKFDRSITMPLDYSEWFTELNADEYGYVRTIKVGDRTLCGGDVWRAFGLRSAAFTAEYKNGVFVFTTYGYGHGAGLSQYGAEKMAESGKTAEEILNYYFSGAKII